VDASKVVKANGFSYKTLFCVLLCGDVALVVLPTDHLFLGLGVDHWSSNVKHVVELTQLLC
jgi:hypothetical protein